MQLRTLVKLEISCCQVFQVKIGRREKIEVRSPYYPALMNLSNLINPARVLYVYTAYTCLYVYVYDTVCLCIYMYEPVKHDKHRMRPAIHSISRDTVAFWLKAITFLF